MRSTPRPESPFARLRRLSSRDWLDAGRASVALWRAQARVWRSPTGSLVQEPPDRTEEGSTVWTEVARWEIAVARAARYSGRSWTCLVRALALSALLTRAGVRGARVRIGVKWVGGTFQAHAWVECGGKLLGDDYTHVRGYAPMADATPGGR
jgi:hypothetical protein